jgi:hypothetical protein
MRGGQAKPTISLASQLADRPIGAAVAEARTMIQKADLAQTLGTVAWVILQQMPKQAHFQGAAVVHPRSLEMAAVVVMVTWSFIALRRAHNAYHQARISACNHSRDRH